MNKPVALLSLCAALLVPAMSGAAELLPILLSEGDRPLPIDEWMRGGTPITSGTPILAEPMSISIHLDPVVYVREDAGVFSVPVVVRSWVPGDPTKFEIVTVDGTAKAGSDYVRPPRVHEPIVLYMPDVQIPAYPLISPPGFVVGEPVIYPPIISQWFLGDPPTIFPSIGRTITLNVSIPILNPPKTAGETVESFTVALRAPKGMKLNIGQRSVVTVRIIDSVDNKPPPAPTITQPAAVLPEGQVPDSAVLVSGLARDDKGVQSVEVSLNGSPFSPANLTSPGLPSTLYSLKIQPQQYVNELRVRTRDWNDQLSPAAVRTFRFRKFSPLVVNVDAAQATLTPAGFAGKTAREEGVKFNISVTPKKGAMDDPVFERWIVEGAKLEDIGVTPAALLKPALSFTHAAGLEITAHFAPNRFPKGAATYHAVLRSPSSLRTNETSGFITLNVMPTKAFSVRLLLGGKVHRLTGTFAQTTVTPVGTDGIPYGVELLLDQSVDRPLRLSLSLMPGTPHPYIYCAVLTDTVIRANVVSITPVQRWQDGIHELNIPGQMTLAEVPMSFGVARIALYDGAKKTVPAEYLGAQGAPGYFTSKVYATRTYTPTQPYEETPQASGVASMSVVKNGLVTYYGRLADDTPFTASTVVVEAMRCPFLVPLYGGKGFLTSELEFTPWSPGADLIGTENWWCRPPQEDALHYPKGWPQSLRMDLEVAKYAPNPDRTLFYFSNGSPEPIMAPVRDRGNVSLSIGDYITVPSEWTLPHPQEVFTTSLNIANDGIVTTVPNQPGGWTLQMDPVTGHCHGIFEHPDGSHPSFRGVIYRFGKHSSVLGYYTSPLPKDEGGSGYIYISPWQYSDS